MSESSEFRRFLGSRANLRTYFEPLAGNQGDHLIALGARHVMSSLGCRLVDDPRQAEQILINGGGAMTDTWGGAAINTLAKHRRDHPGTPVIVGPSSFQFSGTGFHEAIELGHAPLTLFSRERYSAQLLRDAGLPDTCDVHLSHDLALELEGSDFIEGLLRTCREEHVLIALRKDKEGSAGILARTRGKWLPRSLRRPLSRLRDRLVAQRSGDTTSRILAAHHVPANARRLYRDVSASLSFDQFVAAVGDAAFIVTDRLHVGVLGHLLRKRVVLLPGSYHKIRGVFEMSLSGPGSSVSLWDGDKQGRVDAAHPPAL